MSLSMTEAAREARARRALARDGMTVRRDRAHSWNVNHQGGYMVVKRKQLHRGRRELRPDA